MSSKWSVIALVAVLTLAHAPAFAWEIPLTVENSMRTGIPPFVSGGVPLLPGQAKETSDLRLVIKDAAGKTTAVPAQFRVLARYWRGDNSIRWVLVDFAAACVPGEKKVAYLTDAKPESATTRPAAKADEGADTIVIATGVAKFTINKKKFNLLQSAVVDGAELLDSSADVGTVIEDILGEKYYSSPGAKSVEVLEHGPVGVCVRARGQHLVRDGKGYSRGMYGYDTYGKQSPIDPRYFSTLFAVLYTLTGEQKYRDAVTKSGGATRPPSGTGGQESDVSALGAGGGQRFLTAHGSSYFLPSDHWLLTHPPKKQ